MIERTTSRRRRVLALSAVLIGSLLLLEILFDPLSWLLSARVAASLGTELSSAQEMWQSQGITDYSIDVEGFVPLACVINATLTVRGGELAGVESYGLPGLETEQGVSIGPAEWDSPLCPYTDLLVPELFARIERNLERIDWSVDTLRVGFDSEYGYVTEYRYTCCYRSGLLNPTCSDCVVWFRFSNFRPIADL